MSTKYQYFYTLGVEVCFTMCVDFTWRVSDCEELVGLLTGTEVCYKG